MFGVDSYAAVRRFVFVEGHSRREAARVFGLSRETVLKMCRFSLPPGYTRTVPVVKPKLGALLPVIDTIMETDRTGPVKQRHTAKRIFERLRDEHGFGGGDTVVKDYVRLCRARGRETFVPLAHPPGHSQVDFGEAVAVIGGVRQKIHFFCMDLPQSDAPFVKAYPRETTEAFLDGHVSAFAFFGGVPLSLLYDNLKIAVAKICGDGKRERTRAFTELVSHYLFADRFGRPGKGNDTGKVEGLVKYSRSNFMVPIPEAASFDDLNAMLAMRCRASQAERAGRHAETICERLVANTAALRALPAVPLEPCEKRSGRVSSTALVRYRCGIEHRPLGRVPATAVEAGTLTIPGGICGPAKPVDDHAAMPCPIRPRRASTTRAPRSVSAIASGVSPSSVRVGRLNQVRAFSGSPNVSTAPATMPTSRRNRSDSVASTPGWSGHQAPDRGVTRCQARRPGPASSPATAPTVLVASGTTSWPKACHAACIVSSG